MEDIGMMRRSPWRVACSKREGERRRKRRRKKKKLRCLAARPLDKCKYECTI